MKRLLLNATAVLAVAAITHLAVIVAIPRVVMHFVVSRAVNSTGVNTPFHMHLPTAADRRIPLPSPDLLYSGCALDVTQGPVAVSVTPGSEYLSLSAFDMKSDNVFVTSDREAKGQPIRLLFTDGSTPLTAPAGTQLVTLADGHGLLLLRGLAATPEMAAHTEAARHTLGCQATTP